MKIAFLGRVWPEPSSSAAGVRTQLVLQVLKEAGGKILFSAPSQKTERGMELNGDCLAPLLRPNDPAFDSWICDFNPDVVIFDTFIMEEQFGWRVREHCPNAVRMVDTQDLHFLRRTRERSVLGNTQIDFHHSDTYRELGSILRSDFSWLLSDFEYALLRDEFQFPMHLTSVNRLLVSAIFCKTKTFSKRRHFVFIGNFRHAPNQDALKELEKNIWPAIHFQLPNVECHVWGAYPSREWKKSLPAGLKIMGTMENLEDLSHYRVNLAPLRFGAGIKGKILEGWRRELPVVTTPVGMEGIGNGRDPVLGVAASTDELIQIAVNLYTQENLWQKAVEEGRKILETRFSFDCEAKSLVQDLENVVKNYETQRKKNWMGLLLNFHHNDRLKYFSKYLELKSKGNEN